MSASYQHALSQDMPLRLDLDLDDDPAPPRSARRELRLDDWEPARPAPARAPRPREEAYDIPLEAGDEQMPVLSRDQLLRMSNHGRAGLGREERAERSLEVRDDQAPPLSRDQLLRMAKSARRRREEDELVDSYAERAEISPRPRRQEDGLVDLYAERRVREQEAEDLTKTHAAGNRVRPLARFAQPEEAPSFYLSLSDLMSLLLVFFVLIFSLSEFEAKLPDKGNLAQAAEKVMAKVASTLSPASELLPGGPETRLAPAASSPAPAVGAAAAMPGMIERTPVDVPQARPQQPAERRNRIAAAQENSRHLLAMLTSAAPLPAAAFPVMEEPMEKQVRQAIIPAGKGVSVSRRAGRLVVLLPASITFDVAKAEIRPGMAGHLAKLAEVLTRWPEARVVVTGHTDDMPISNSRFASNWELSAARAAVVARALLDKGVAKPRVTIQGLADLRPRAPNDSPSHRALNRRVEIELVTDPAAAPTRASAGPNAG